MSTSLTRTDIAEGLHRLGVKPGMMLEVHCSLGSFGYVDGGADTVIEALKDAVGSDGAIVMPSFRLSPNLPLDEDDKALGLTLKIKILENDEVPSGMGVVANTFRKMPDVVIGEGVFRVSAWGKDAEKHSLGFQRLVDSGGYALLMGVDIYSLSSMHYAEDILPVEIKDLFQPSEEARNRYTESEWFIEAWEPPVKPWYTIQERAYQRGYVIDGMIGNIKCMLVKVKGVLDIYREALQSEPFTLYGLE